MHPSDQLHPDLKLRNSPLKWPPGLTVYAGAREQLPLAVYTVTARSVLLLSLLERRDAG